MDTPDKVLIAVLVALCVAIIALILVAAYLLWKLRQQKRRRPSPNIEINHTAYANIGDTAHTNAPPTKTNAPPTKLKTTYDFGPPSTNSTDQVASGNSKQANGGQIYENFNGARDKVEYAEVNPKSFVPNKKNKKSKDSKRPADKQLVYADLDFGNRPSSDAV